LILLGTILPWQVFQTRPGYGLERDSFQVWDVNGHSHNDGLAVLLAGIAIIVMLAVIGVLMRYQRNKSRVHVVPNAISIACIGLGVTAVALLLAQYSKVAAVINQVNAAAAAGVFGNTGNTGAGTTGGPSALSGSLGQGFWCCLIGAVLVMLASWYLVKVRRSQRVST
jgi:hypothetical protein